MRDTPGRDSLRDARLLLVLQALDPRERPWSGAPSPAGSLRNIHLETAIRKSGGLKHCIWELALHIAYWEYAVRRILEKGPKGGFPRSPASWPVLPDAPTENAWKEDRQLVKKERAALITAIRTVDVRRLDEPSSEGSQRTIADILFGIVQHSAYHTGQISLLKRLAHH